MTFRTCSPNPYPPERRRGKGRPMAGTAPRIHTISTMLTADEKTALKARAVAAGKKTAAYLYGLVVADLERTP